MLACQDTDDLIPIVGSPHEHLGTWNRFESVQPALLLLADPSGAALQLGDDQAALTDENQIRETSTVSGDWCAPPLARLRRPEVSYTPTGELRELDDGLLEVTLELGR